MKMIRLLSLAVGLALAGCASQPKTAKVDPRTINWNERVGSYTYDQAIAELGKPAITGESGDGKTAEWILQRSPQMSFGFGVGGGGYGSHSMAGVGVGSSVSPPSHGENLRLRFDQEGKLKEWSKARY